MTDKGRSRKEIKRETGRNITTEIQREIQKERDREQLKNDQEKTVYRNDIFH